MHRARLHRHGDPLTVRVWDYRIIHTNGYVRVWMPGTALADGMGYVYEHRHVLMQKIGPGTHPCHHCGKPVHWYVSSQYEQAALVVDHLDHNKTNNDPRNLVPSCQPCNAKRDRSRDAKGRFMPGVMVA